ncbi:hypothetical protein [Candidatus Uabimicrobium amorphum]|uniref:Uncharacterized protein n=1 Tax=Uabimicrobium amorphum TaxID=2596890 RepID=A0A5S9F3F9_UABAM|nr:hypothetical protein [Candidatus Uabimicrobium amorphum]BBM84211.1 hypothetical protein UABAM_02567 [Candidatus Uabimicrobium amorphum]
MSEEKNAMNNPFLVWGVFILIPVATFALYVYEVFFKEEVPTSSNAEKLYKEARSLETKGNLLKAYVNYSTLAEIHKNSPAGQQAQQRLDAMKKNLEMEILSLAGNGKWTQLRKKRGEVAKLLPDRLSWLDSKLKNKDDKDGKANTNNKPKKEKDRLSQEVENLKEKVDLLIAQQNYTQALELCKQAGLKNRNRKFKKQANRVIAHIHYEYATHKKDLLLAKIDGADIREFKNDFPEEILEITAHFRKFLSMSANTDKRRIKAREFLKKLD